MTAPAAPVARLENVTQLYKRAVALDDVTIALPAGRMVGLIGPDGVGKSTLLAMIAGARHVQSGRVIVLDGDMAAGAHRTAICARIAYMPQGLGKNLYPDLSVRENIEFFARLFGQSRSEREWRIADLLRSTGLAPFADRAAKKLSGGMRQKLGLCCSLIHDPDLLILDEPTTGVDPLSRRQFWELIDRIRRRRPGMSVLIATAYMEEAERFDWLLAMNDGKVLAAGSPAEFKAQTRAKTVEDAFIALLQPDELAHGHEVPPHRILDAEPVIAARDLTCRFGDFTAVDRVTFTIERGEIFGFVGSNGCGKTTTMKMLTGLLAPTEGEALLFGKPLDASDINSRRRVGYMSQSFSLYTELTVRQNLELHARLFHLPAKKAKARLAELIGRFGLERLTFALFGTALLMLVFGFGISTDVNNLTFAVLDRDQSHESRAYLEELRGSIYFVEKAPLTNYADLERRLQTGAIRAAVEVPPGFGRDLEAGRPVWVGAWVDGAMPFRAETIRGYLQAMHQLYLTDPAVKTTLPEARAPARIELRFKYNQNFESVYAMVPTTMSLLLALLPAILMALAIVREKELGSITNLYVTPVTRIEFLLGKQIPFIGLAMANFTIMFLMALFVFQVPLKGSFLALVLGAVIYVTVTTAYGMLISAFASTQIAALFGTVILTVLPATQFSGMLTPVSSLSGTAQLMGRAFPMSYFVPISVGTFTKGLGLADLVPDIVALIIFIPVLIGLSFLLLRKQER